MTEFPLENLSESIYHAMYKIFSDIQYEERDWAKYHKDKIDALIKKSRRPTMRDIVVSGMFTQTWESTALGFGGVGGQAMTSAYTVIVQCGDEYAVYFSGQFAYFIKNPNEKFHEDLAMQCMSDVAGHSIYCRSKERATQ